MDFLPKELEDIILDYKYQLEFSEHKKKMKSTLFSISNLIVDSGVFFGKLNCTYYLDAINKNDTNRIITRTQFTCKTGMRICL